MDVELAGQRPVSAEILLKSFEQLGDMGFFLTVTKSEGFSEIMVQGEVNLTILARLINRQLWPAN